MYQNYNNFFHKQCALLTKLAWVYKKQGKETIAMLVFASPQNNTVDQNWKKSVTTPWLTKDILEKKNLALF